MAAVCGCHGGCYADYGHASTGLASDNCDGGGGRRITNRFNQRRIFDAVSWQGSKRKTIAWAGLQSLCVVPSCGRVSAGQHAGHATSHTDPYFCRQPLTAAPLVRPRSSQSASARLPRLSARVFSHQRVHASSYRRPPLWAGVRRCNVERHLAPFVLVIRKLREEIT